MCRSVAARTVVYNIVGLRTHVGAYMQMGSVMKRLIVIVSIALGALPVLGFAGDAQTKESGKGIMENLDSALKSVGDGVRGAGQAVGSGAKDASKAIDKSAADARKSVTGDKR